MEIDALPDELLLKIFALVADADTLLDGVALTCKRWLRVSRDPAAWANVRAEFRGPALRGHHPSLSDILSEHWVIAWREMSRLPDSDPDEDGDSPPPTPPPDRVSAGVRAAARALLRAPALRAVVLDWATLSDKERRTATTALIFCRVAEVREFRLVGATFHTLFLQSFEGIKTPLRAVVRLLQKYRGCLRALETMILPMLDMGDDVGKTQPSLGLLAEMPLLEELRLHVSGRMFSQAGFAGQLLGRLPRLRVLTVRTDTNNGLDKHSAVLAGDLLRGAASSLRVVYLDISELAAAELAALAACTGLRELHCNAAHVPAIRGMTQLRRLHLEVRQGDRTTDAQLRECLRAVEEDCGEALAGVRRLQLDADVEFYQYELEDKPLVRELYDAVRGRVSDDARVFSCHNDVSPSFANLMAVPNFFHFLG